MMRYFVVNVEKVCINHIDIGTKVGINSSSIHFYLIYLIGMVSSRMISGQETLVVAKSLFTLYFPLPLTTTISNPPIIARFFIKKID